MSVGAWTAAAKNHMLDAELALVTHLSLHRGDPGATGANELSGGSPAYARKAVTWNASSGGVATVASPPTFDVPANGGGAADYYVCGVTASSGGTFKFKIKVASLDFPAQSTLPLAGLSVDHNLGASA